MTSSALSDANVNLEGTTRIAYSQPKVRAKLRRMLISVLWSVGALVFISFREEQHLDHWPQGPQTAGMSNWPFELSMGFVIFAAVIAVAMAILKLARLRDATAGGAHFLTVGPSGIGSAEFSEKLRWRDVAGFAVSDKRNHSALVIHTRIAPASVWERLRNALLRDRFKLPAGLYPVVLKADAVDYPLASLQTLLLGYLERYGKLVEPAPQKSSSSEARRSEVRRG